MATLKVLNPTNIDSPITSWLDETKQRFHPANPHTEQLPPGGDCAN